MFGLEGWDGDLFSFPLSLSVSVTPVAGLFFFLVPSGNKARMALGRGFGVFLSAVRVSLRAIVLFPVEEVWNCVSAEGGGMVVTVFSMRLDISGV
jgi:hypothetical protein